MSFAKHVRRIIPFALVLSGAVGAVGGSAPAAAATDGKLVLVLDSSGSMAQRIGGDSKIAIAKHALNTAVDHLPNGAKVGLRVYGATVLNRSDKGACADSQLVVPIGADNRAAPKQEISTYRPYGETPISYSLKKADEDLGAAGKRSVVLVSTARKPVTPTRVPRRLRWRNTGST